MIGRCENCGEFILVGKDGYECSYCSRHVKHSSLGKDIIKKGRPITYALGFCPYCGSENTDTIGNYLDNSNFIFKLRCLDCGKHSEEVNTLEYDKTVGVDD